jgi:hypothetical protein
MLRAGGGHRRTDHRGRPALVIPIAEVAQSLLSTAREAQALR